jgi:HAD superfamily hydrolase (TIGR01509 family)
VSQLPALSRPAAGGPAGRFAGVRAVLFDMGGVLLEMGNPAGLPQGRLDHRGREALVREIVTHGGHATVEQLEETLFAPWRRQYEQRYLRSAEAAWEPHLRALRRRCGSRVHNLRLLAAWFAPYAASLTPIPGASAVLARLAAAGFALAVVSNVPLPGRLYARRLAELGLLAPFRCLHWSYDSGSRKPSPVMVRAALAALAVPAEAAVMVGDRRSTDVAAGRAAGVATVWLATDPRPGPEPDATIHRLAELPALLGLGPAS